jgi:hypothetical protein
MLVWNAILVELSVPLHRRHVGLALSFVMVMAVPATIRVNVVVMVVMVSIGARDVVRRLPGRKGQPNHLREHQDGDDGFPHVRHCRARRPPRATC